MHCSTLGLCEIIQNCHSDGNLETQGNALIFKIIHLVRVLFEVSEIESNAPRWTERETIFGCRYWETCVCVTAMSLFVSLDWHKINFPFARVISDIQKKWDCRDTPVQISRFSTISRFYTTVKQMHWLFNDGSFVPPTPPGRSSTKYQNLSS